MVSDMQLLQQVKEMAIKIRNGNADSGKSYLLGYLWATLTPEQQNETALAFSDELIGQIEQ
jgi:hypothetical protein